MLKNYKKFSESEKIDFKKELTVHNFKISKLVVPMLIATGFAVAILLASTRNFKMHTDFLYLFAFLSLSIAGIVYFVLQHFFFNMPEKHTKIMQIMLVVFSAFMIVWAILVGLLDNYCDGKNTPVILLTTFMGLAGAIYIHPKISIPTFVSSIIVFCIIDYTVITEDISVITILSYVLFLVVVVIISLNKFNYSVKEFILKNKLKTQNFELKNTNEQLKCLNSQLEKIATTDTLTGLKNRWSFSYRMAEVYKYCKDNRKMLSLAIFDLDDFKLVNDRYGHPVGDVCLKEVAETFRKHVAPADLFRYGGEEFVMLFKDMSEEKVFKILDSIRVDVQRMSIGEQDIRMTICGGQFSCIPTEGIDSVRFLINADRALYIAKTEGKNRVVMYTPGENELPH